MRTIINYLLAILIFIFSGCAYLEDTSDKSKISEKSQVQEYPYYTYDLFCRIYEVHQQYMKKIDYVEISTYGDEFTLSDFDISKPDHLKNEEELYDIEFSDNIGGFDTLFTGNDKDIRKPDDIRIFNIKVHFKENLKGNKKYSFWISYKVKRKPYEKDEWTYFKLQIRPDKIAERNFAVLAIPSDSKEQEAYTNAENKKIEKNGWKYFVYKLSKNFYVRMNFYIEKDNEGLKMEEIIKVLE